MMNFKQWINESFTGNTGKANQIARRIWANVAVVVHKQKNKESFQEFQKWAMGQHFHEMAVYKWLTQRISGKEESNPQNTQEIQKMTQEMASAAHPPEAVYVKGSGWHHWIINGDMGRSVAGTYKTYIPIHYKSLLPQAQAVMAAILKNLVYNGYKGQIKISTGAKNGWLDRMDNIVLHSGTPEWAQFGANVTKKVLDKFGVKIGGAATSGEMEQGLDPKGTDQSFNSFASDKASKAIAEILKNTRDYDHFMRNVQNYFAPNGPYVQELLKILN